MKTRDKFPVFVNRRYNELLLDLFDSFSERPSIGDVKRVVSIDDRFISLRKKLTRVELERSFYRAFYKEPIKFGITRGTDCASSYSVSDLSLGSWETVRDALLNVPTFFSNDTYPVANTVFPTGTILSEGKVADQNAFDILVESGLLTACRNLALSHERARGKLLSDARLIMRFPWDIRILHYSEDTLKPLAGHVDGVPAPSQIVPVVCNDTDKSVLQVKQRGHWNAVAIQESQVATLSRGVFHRVNAPAKRRVVLLLLWNKSTTIS
jgi:hypothetical protein